MYEEKFVSCKVDFPESFAGQRSEKKIPTWGHALFDERVLRLNAQFTISRFCCDILTTMHQTRRLRKKQLANRGRWGTGSEKLTSRVSCFPSSEHINCSSIREACSCSPVQSSPVSYSTFHFHILSTSIFSLLLPSSRTNQLWFSRRISLKMYIYIYICNNNHISS